MSTNHPHSTCLSAVGLDCDAISELLDSGYVGLMSGLHSSPCAICVTRPVNVSRTYNNPLATHRLSSLLLLGYRQRSSERSSCRPCANVQPWVNLQKFFFAVPIQVRILNSSLGLADTSKLPSDPLGKHGSSLFCLLRSTMGSPQRSSSRPCAKTQRSAYL